MGHGRLQQPLASCPAPSSFNAVLFSKDQTGCCRPAHVDLYVCSTSNMIAPRLARRFQYKLAIISALAFCLTAWVLLAHKRPPRRSLDEEALRRGFPLVYKHIHSFRGKGGGERQPTTTDYLLCTSNSRARTGR